MSQDLLKNGIFLFVCNANCIVLEIINSESAITLFKSIKDYFHDKLSLVLCKNTGLYIVLFN